jgi:NitT/TauT family transport system ATP-binding protein
VSDHTASLTPAAGGPDATDGPVGDGEISGGISVRGVTKRYQGDRGTVALAGVDLVVGGQRWVTLIGPSGCGKSTLLRIVAGLAEPTEGEVLVLDRPPREAAAETQIAWVPQSPALLPWRSALGNVRLPHQVNRGHGRQGDRGDAVALLRAVGLGDSLDKYPAELSGGMQQRVAIARAFALAAPVLVMDEPFSALDELTREDLRHQLLELWQTHRATVLFVTHSVAEAVTLSDTVVVMSARPGRIQGIVPITLGRPRPAGIEDSPAFHEAEADVRRLLRAGA